MVSRSMNKAMLAAAMSLTLSVAAQAAPLGHEVSVGYVQIADDPRYDEKEGPAETTVALGRPVAGAAMAVDEVNIDAATTGRTYKLVKAEVDGGDALAAKIDAMVASGVHWFVIDAPDGAMAALAKAERGKDAILFNISARGDTLRGAACQPELLDVIPSRAMLADALAQFLVARKWPKVLVLRGPLPEDKKNADAFAHAAKRFGLSIAATRDFIVSNDPRHRDEDNIALLTGDASYDVVYVADADGTFARGLPYATIYPRPVIGAAGLVPTAWSWTWERYGAPQVSHRFKKRAGRDMTETDWAAWLAVRALDDALRESHATTSEAADKYLLGPDMNIDGAKGPPLSFRSWDHQLRQPILLTTADATIADAPMPGFLHQSNVLDTLGYDKPETQCKF
jgi:ABC transporter substrate binding protein (PQQ-dependent alcohol dehydrogenase system)